MITKEFYALVERMRNAQKEYFRTRDKSALSASKQLEREVDEAIKKANEKEQSPSLFD